MANELKQLQKWLEKELKKQQREEEKLARNRKKQLEFDAKNNGSHVHRQSAYVQSRRRGSIEYGSSNNYSYKDTSYVIVKTNFQLAGFSKDNNGVRLTGSRIVQKMNKSLNYIARDGANEDLENSSNLYNSKAILLSKDEYASFQDELNEMDLSGFRRIMISPNSDLSREEMNELVLRTMHDFSNKTEKFADYIYAIHTNTENIHSHIIVTSEHFNDIKWTKDELDLFKELVQENTRELLIERENSLQNQLKNELEKELEITKEKEQTNEHYRSI